jgi:hypothetical protein
MSTEKPIDYDYPRGLTFEQVWASIQKLSESIQELDKKHEAIFEREAKEREERQKAEDERRKEREARHAEDMERLRKLEKLVEKNSRDINGTNKKVGELDNRFGELIEHLIAPDMACRFKELGYSFEDVVHPFGFQFKQDGMVVAQADILLENDDTILVIEIKAKPNNDDIKRLGLKLSNIRKYYEQDPVRNKKILVGALAGAIFPQNIKQYTIQSGFFVITQKGDTIKIDVPKGFEPRKF